MIILGFYLLYIVLAIVLAVIVFRLLKRRGRLLAVVVSLLCLSLLAGFFPIPIHGGFTFPLEIAWHELKREQWQHDARQVDQRENAFRQKQQQRFNAALHFQVTDSRTKGWQVAVLDSGESVWLDEESGLLWQPPPTVSEGARLLTLDEAKTFCRNKTPQAYWALPTEAELALFWQHDGHQLMPGAGQSSTALLLDSDLQMEMATHYRGRVAGHALRCVAISDAAPRGGYLSGDIPLALWNDYQLNKGDIYHSTTAQ